jgi:trigger factor
VKTQLNKTDELNASLHLTIEPEDFLPEYEKQIKQINKTTKMPGFRPGHIPKSMIEKKFGDQVLVESVLNIANDKVNSYVKEEKLDILGYPLSSENQAQIDVFTKDKSYEFRRPSNI